MKFIIRNMTKRDRDCVINMMRVFYASPAVHTNGSEEIFASDVENCINDGIPVKGYCYWSLMDNFEWQKGFSMTFGLIAVDRSTQERTPKESLAYLGSFAAE